MLAVEFAFCHLLKCRRPIAVAALTLALSVRVSAANGAERNRSNEWLTGTPEEVGLDSAPLVEMFEYARQHSVPMHSVQIVRHGRLARKM